MIEGLAALCVAQAQYAPGIILFSAAAAARVARQVALLPAFRAEVERSIAIVQMHLEAADFETAWTTGQVMTLEHAEVYALQPLPV